MRTSQDDRVAGTSPLHEVPPSRVDRVHAMVGAVLLVAGSVAFTAGGRLHPQTDTSLGPIGSPEYFVTFAQHVLATPGWQDMHAALLAGPVLWALGAVGFLHLGWAPRQGRGFAHTGVVGLAMGAALWAVVFVVDGFVAPLLATGAAAGDFTAESLTTFRNAQELVARLGLVSWMLIGVGIAGVAVAVAVTRGSTRLGRLVVAVPGVLIGLWPVLGWAIGPFRPSVFTSPLWTPTAAVTSLWFLLAAALLAWWGIAGRSWSSTARS